MLKLKREEKVKILHYVLMPTHVHLLVGLGEKSNLSRFMMRLNLRYSNYFRKKHNYSGHLWQGRFKSKLIDNDSYFIQCGKYIELNPVRANIVDKAELFPFSSYLYYSAGLKDKLVDEDPIYSSLAEDVIKRQQTYKKIIINEIVAERLSRANSNDKSTDDKNFNASSNGCNEKG
jgi:putative transposase